MTYIAGPSWAGRRNDLFEDATPATSAKMAGLCKTNHGRLIHVTNSFGFELHAPRSIARFGRCDQRSGPEHFSEADDRRAAESGPTQSAGQQGHAGTNQPDPRGGRDRQAHTNARVG